MYDVVPFNARRFDMGWRHRVRCQECLAQFTMTLKDVYWIVDTFYWFADPKQPYKKERFYVACPVCGETHQHHEDFFGGYFGFETLCTTKKLILLDTAAVRALKELYPQNQVFRE